MVFFHFICTGKDIPSYFAAEQGTIPAKKVRRGRPLEEERVQAFERVVQYFEENDEEQLTIQCLAEKMEEFLANSESEPYSTFHMKKRIIERYGEDVVIAEINGRADVVTMRPTAARILQKFYYEPKQQNTEEEETRLVKAAAALIKNDIKSCRASKEIYPNSEDMSSPENAIAFLPQALLQLLDILVVGVDKRKKIASIGQAIMQAARPRVLIAPLQLGLAVQMHHHFGSRFLIDSLHHHGFCSSYSEVQNYEKNAAVATGIDLDIPDGECLVQYVADNVDHNVRTIDGKNTFHGMGIISTITPRNKQGGLRSIIPRRKDISTEEIAQIGQINILRYHSNDVPRGFTYSEMSYNEIDDPTANLDFLWKMSWLLKQDRPAYSGFMQLCQDGKHPGKSDVIFLPMIDLDPSNVSCVYSTLVFVSNHAKKYNVTPILTFDQPLWWKAMCIANNEPTNSCLRRIVLRLGAFHTQMSFLGSIGHLMKGSGLKEALEVVYAENAVTHMLTGKAVQRAVQGHLLVDATLNALILAQAYDMSLTAEDKEIENESDILADNVPSHAASETVLMDDNEGIIIPEKACENLEIDEMKHDLERVLSEELSAEEACKSRSIETVKKRINEVKSTVMKSRTGKLWLQYMEMIDILRTFIKAERTGEWELHLQCVEAMLPYFAASGHNLYTKSARIYVQEMKRLKEEESAVYTAFVNGFHVIRRSDRYWAGLSSDLVIEQVLMRSLKTTGGLTHGRGMSEIQRLVWLLSMPVTAEINGALQEFTGVNYTSSEQHKDTFASRIERDMNDTKKILAFMDARNPFSEDPSLRCVVTGVTADERANADRSKEIGKEILTGMTGKSSEEYVFRKVNQAIVINTHNHPKAINEEMQVDPLLLFQRLITVRNFTGQDGHILFKYELCTVPASLFEANGLPRQANKPALADAIWKAVDADAPYPSQPFQYVIDGGSLLQRLPWKRGAQFSSILDSYISYVKRRYGKAVIVFDGYESGPAPKDVTHQRRTGQSAGVEVKFKEDMLLAIKKEIFLANKGNKQRFINMLGQKLEEEGCEVYYSEGDADFDIVRKAVDVSANVNTVVVGEDTDLLILLLYHAKENRNQIFFCPEQKQNSKKKSKVWDIQMCQRVLGSKMCQCILFLHAFLGCDTTSSIFGIGKGLSIRAFNKSEQFQQCASVFCDESSSKEQVCEAGEKALIIMYNGKEEIALDEVRYNIFCEKLVSAKTQIRPEAIPPTSAAAKFHSMRVYCQVMMWKGREIDPKKWGWKVINDAMFPCHTDLACAPEELLKLICCQCKKGCTNMRCSCKKNGLACSFACGECRGVSCDNSMHPEIDDDCD